jgi:acetyl esterase/lipase
MTDASTHVVVLPGGDYSQHAPHEGEPVAQSVRALGIPASMFQYPKMARHPTPHNALRAEVRQLRNSGSARIGVMGFSAGGHLAGLAALAAGARADEIVDFAVLGCAIT